MTKYRFYINTWSKAEGHCERRIVARGTTMETALEIVTRTLEARTPGIIVAPKAFELVTV